MWVYDSIKNHQHDGIGASFRLYIEARARTRLELCPGAGNDPRDLDQIVVQAHIMKVNKNFLVNYREIHV